MIPQNVCPSRVESDLTIRGHYDLSGTALGFIPATGNGKFSISLKGFKVSAVSSMKLQQSAKTMKKKTLEIRDLDVQINYEQVKFDFENLMGGGVIGNTANTVINSVGEAIVENQRSKIIANVKQVFRDQISNLF